MSSIFEGLNEALAIAKGARNPARLHVPPEVSVHAIRAKAGISQDRFSSAFGFTIHPNPPVGAGAQPSSRALRVYLMLIDRSPTTVLQSLHAASVPPRHVRSRVAA